MKESHYRKFLAVMVIWIVGIFGWAIYRDDPEQWGKAIGFVVLSLPVGFWLIKKVCDICRRSGSLSAERKREGGADGRK